MHAKLTAMLQTGSRSPMMKTLFDQSFSLTIIFFQEPGKGKN